MRSVSIFVVMVCAGPIRSAAAQNADMLVSSRLGNAVLRYDGSGQSLGRFDGASPLFTPNGVLVRGEHVYVSSRDGGQILRYFLSSGAFDRVFAQGPEMVGPSGIVFGPDGDLFVANSLADNISRYDGQTGTLKKTTSTAGTLSAPVGIAFGSDGQIYATGAVNHTLARYDGGTMDFEALIAQGGLLGTPADIRRSPFDGHLYIANATQNRIARYNTTAGTLSNFLFSSQLLSPTAIAFDNDGHLYVTSFAADKVVKVTRGGVLSGNYIASQSGGLDGPQFVTFIPEPAGIPLLTLALICSRGRATGKVQAHYPFKHASR